MLHFKLECGQDLLRAVFHRINERSAQITYEKFELFVKNLLESGQIQNKNISGSLNSASMEGMRQEWEKLTRICPNKEQQHIILSVDIEGLEFFHAGDFLDHFNVAEFFGRIGSYINAAQNSPRNSPSPERSRERERGAHAERDHSARKDYPNIMWEPSQSSILALWFLMTENDFNNQDMGLLVTALRDLPPMVSNRLFVRWVYGAQKMQEITMSYDLRGIIMGRPGRASPGTPEIRSSTPARRSFQGRNPSWRTPSTEDQGTRALMDSFMARMGAQDQRRETEVIGVHLSVDNVVPYLQCLYKLEEAVCAAGGFCNTAVILSILPSIYSAGEPAQSWVIEELKGIQERGIRSLNTIPSRDLVEFIESITRHFRPGGQPLSRGEVNGRFQEFEQVGSQQRRSHVTRVALPGEADQPEPQQGRRRGLWHLHNRQEREAFMEQAGASLTPPAVHVAEQRRRNARAGVAFEIHDYADTEVFAPKPGSAAASCALPLHPRKDLLNAVFDNMIQRLGKNALIPFEEVEQQFRTIRRFDRNRVFYGLTEDDDFRKQFSIAYTFLKKFHPDKINLWMEQFIGESLNAYGEGDGSCTRGVQDRIGTGLRDIDAELDAIFVQVEGPMLMRKFCTILNPVGESQKLARYLMTLGVRPGMSPAEIIQKFRTDFATKLKEHGQQDNKRFKEEETIYVEQIEGALEDVDSPLNKAIQKEDAAKTLQGVARGFLARKKHVAKLRS